MQPSPDGLAQAYILAEDFLAWRAFGDGAGGQHLFRAWLAGTDGARGAQAQGGTVFGYHVADPERYGVVDFDTRRHGARDRRKTRGAAVELRGDGLYFLDGSAPATGAAMSSPSPRGELEITSLLGMYLADGAVAGGNAWGAAMPGWIPARMAVLLDAGNFVRTLEERQGLQTGCPEEIAFQQGWISRDELKVQAERYKKNAYGTYLSKL